MTEEKIPFYERLEFWMFFVFILPLLVYWVIHFAQGIVDRPGQMQSIDYSNCSFEYPTTPVIVLRLDDVQGGTYGDTQQKIISDILNRGKSVSLAVIPSRLGGDTITKYLNKIKNNEKVEIALHGMSHKRNEFQNLSYEDAYNKIFEGKELIQKNFNVVPITFIPPGNVYNNHTINALKILNFKIISATTNEIKMEEQLVFLGKTSQTADYLDLDEYVLPTTYNYTYVLEKCRNTLNSINLCIIMIHPQDFVDSGKRRIDNYKYLQFTTLLGELDTIPNIQYKTFRDLLTCGGKNERTGKEEIKEMGTKEKEGPY